MTRDEFIDAVNRFEKLERTQCEFSNELDKVLCKYTDNQNRTFTLYCAQACGLGMYYLVKFAFPKLTAEEVKQEVDYFTGDCDYGKDPRDVKFKGKEYLLDGAGSFYDYLRDL
jgi:hypothetical protein